MDRNEKIMNGWKEASDIDISMRNFIILIKYWIEMENIKYLMKFYKNIKE